MSASDQEHDDAVNDLPDVCQAAKRTPLPKLQLAVVFLIQFAEPVTAMVIYPFVNQLVRETGITGGNEAKTGYYAGVLESMFFLSETLTVFAWGWLSDRVGRRPILLLGPIGLAMSTLSFGLTTSYWPLVYSRALQGLFNGNIGVSKSVIVEITDSTNIGDAYAFSPLMWAIGGTVGPMLGGVLRHPATRWPQTFGNTRFFRDYPYFLPCASASAIAFLSFAFSTIALRETLPVRPNRSWGPWRQKIIARLTFVKRKAKSSETPLLGDTHRTNYGSSVSEAGFGIPATTPPLAELFVPAFTWKLVNFGCFAFVDMAVFALIPLVYSTPIEYGGLGMDPFTIGLIMGSFAMANGILSALCLGSLLRRWDPKVIFQHGILSLFVSFAAFPIQNAFARRAGRADSVVMTLVLLQFVAQTSLPPCYASMSVLIVQSCPHKRLMGSANGAAQMVTSGGRVVAPVLASSLFSMMIQHDLAGGKAVYYVGLLLVVCLVYLSRQLH